MESLIYYLIFLKVIYLTGVKEDEIIEVALDSLEFEELCDRKKLYEYIKSKVIDNRKYYLLLDEIQLVDGFEFLLNGLLRVSNIDCYVTGSNSKFLSSDIITEFRGRGD